ncbi:hypothetical protein [Hymenobacter algoricola]|uniref:STAS domain-containing protein n=1 Tax=Hymenobacter algoricola TaxID=486267 RepID=A0ABP7MGR4_9BACT
MEVYREILPESYLLILVDDIPPRADADQILHKSLRRAAHGGKASVWVDCSNLRQLPGHAAELLRRYRLRLGQRGISLILCHLSEEVCQALLTQDASLSSLVVPTLLDAQRYCQQRVNRQRASWQRQRQRQIR